MCHSVWSVWGLFTEELCNVTQWSSLTDTLMPVLASQMLHEGTDTLTAVQTHKQPSCCFLASFGCFPSLLQVPCRITPSLSLCTAGCHHMPWNCKIKNNCRVVITKATKEIQYLLLFALHEFPVCTLFQCSFTVDRRGPKCGSGAVCGPWNNFVWPLTACFSEFILDSSNLTWKICYKVLRYVIINCMSVCGCEVYYCYYLIIIS